MLPGAPLDEPPLTPLHTGGDNTVEALPTVEVYPDQSGEFAGGTALPGQDAGQVDEGWVERYGDDDELGATYLEIRGIEDPERGYPIRDDFDTHLSAVDRNGNGGHKHHHQTAWLDQQGATYTANETDSPGIYQITGRFINADGKRVEVNKTTYDPSYFETIA